MQTPLLSIIIPVYNAEKTIERTLLSLNRIVTESKKAVEVIIVNDGSTDGSMERVRTMMDRLAPLTVEIVAQDNRGLASARNTGLAHCHGAFVFLLDADDELAFDPVPHIQEHADATSLGFSVLYSTAAHHYRTRRPTRITLQNNLDVFTAENVLPVCSLFFRRDRVASLFDPDFLSLEDWLFWMMNPSIFERMEVFPDIAAAVVHVHTENMTFDNMRMGKHRRKVAEYVLAGYKERLNQKQKNNLKIQFQIGAIQQGGRASLRTFCLFPCSLKLYGLLILYAVAGTRLSRIALNRRW